MTERGRLSVKNIVTRVWLYTKNSWIHICFQTDAFFLKNVYRDILSYSDIMNMRVKWRLSFLI